MPGIAAKTATAVCLLGAALAMSGCVQSRLRLSNDFGRAVRQDLAAQVADPDAVYKGWPPPGSNGRRVSTAQSRYERNAVIQPASTGTSTSSSGGGGGSGGGSGSGGSGASAGP